jgi:hypothetical protein
MAFEGLSAVLGNLNAAEQRVLQGKALAAEEICQLLQSDAKQQAPFTDRTGNLRNSIKAEIEQVSLDAVTLIFSAGMNYAAYVELRFDKRFAYLLPTLDRNRSRMIEIVGRHLAF